MRKTLLIGVIFLSLVGCRYFKKGHPTGQPIARVFDQYLYTSDLKGVVAPGTNSKDSTEVVKNYINNWIQQELLVHHAENNLPGDQKDFAQELETYRRSLIIYAFETEYIKQKFDTVIPEKEITAYYEANKENFKLRENICRVVWAKFPLKAPAAGLNKIKQLFNQGKISKLGEACSGRATQYDVADTAWVFFNDLTQVLPIHTDDPEAFMKSHTFAELRDATSIYFVRFTHVQNRETTSPLNLERENIRSLLLNKRRLGVLDKLEKDLYDQASKNKDFEILAPVKSRKGK